MEVWMDTNWLSTLDDQIYGMRMMHDDYQRTRTFAVQLRRISIEYLELKFGGRCPQGHLYAVYV